MQQPEGLGPRFDRIADDPDALAASVGLTSDVWPGAHDDTAGVR